MGEGREEDMNPDDWEEYDPDYGVFGDEGGLLRRSSWPLPKPDPVREAANKRFREREENRRRASREFNSHMIHLFNEGQRK